MCGGQRTFVNYILKMHTSSVVVVENGEKEPEWNSNSSVDSKFKANIAKRWWKGRLCLVFGGTTTIIGLVIAVLGLLNDMDALPKSDENLPVPATSARISPTNTILPGCSCNGFIDKYDGGECREEFGENGYFCYVEDGSCSDAYFFDGLYYSYEACKTKATALAPTTSSPSNVADANISATIQVEVRLEMLSKMQSKEGSPTTITTKSTTTTTTTTETTTTTTTTTTITRKSTTTTTTTMTTTMTITTTTITPTTTTTILPGCSCNGFIDTDDGGECREEYGEKGYWCYVEVGSCSNAYLYGDLYYSYEACKTKVTATALGCSCNGFIDTDDEGECREEFGENGYW